MPSTNLPTPPSGAPAFVSEDDAALRVVFPRPVRWPAWIMLPAWAAVVIVSIASVASGPPPAGGTIEPAEAVLLLLSMLCFGGMWLTIVFLMLYRLLFNAFGRDLIILDATRLTFRREVPLFTRVRRYQLADIRNLRPTRSYIPLDVARWFGNSRYTVDLVGLTGGVIAFDYRGHTVRIGGGITDEEAGDLVARMVRRFPSLGSPPQ